MISCSTMPQQSSSSKTYDAADLFADDSKFAEEKMLSVLNCFDDNDTAGLKELFSESVVKHNELDKQIEKAFDSYDGKSVSHKEAECEICQSECGKDHYTYKSIRIIMDNVVTNSNKEYFIELVYVLVNEEDPSQVGLLQLSLYDAKDTNKELISFIGEKI